MIARHGFAAGCEAGLRPAVGLNYCDLGYAPGSGSAHSNMGRSPYQGHSPFLYIRADGEAKPRLTSGGEAVTESANIKFTKCANSKLQSAMSKLQNAQR